jgi:soluble lytic murein transglycosylase-like protein
MPKARIVAIAAAASLALSIGISMQPAYAAARKHATPLTARRAAVQAVPVHLTRAQARAILVRAAHHHGLNPNFVLAVSYWESGWNQAAVSRTGAVGLMQVEPYTAAWAGPALLHRAVNLNNPVDNAELGAALLRSYLDQLRAPRLVLAAYYQGLSAVRKHGIFPSSRRYVDGIWKLRYQFQTAGYSH